MHVIKAGLVSIVVLLTVVSAQAEEAKPAAITTKGAVAGKPFVPKVALSFSKLNRNGVTYLMVELLDDPPASCNAVPHPKAGSRQVYLPLPWTKGAKLDLANAKLHGNWNPETMMEANDKGLYDNWVKEWTKPNGNLTVLEAPKEKGATGRFLIELHMGDYSLQGELPVMVCTAL